MPSEVDIANGALAYLGDPAILSVLYPPDGSPQSAMCARFYPMARDALLELHAWGFATKRVALPLLALTPPSSWLYAYSTPNDALNLIAILDPAALDDTVTGVSGFLDTAYSSSASSFGGVGYYTPQAYKSEAAADGTGVIYTNQANAVLIYSAAITDPTQFSPLFTETLQWFLSSKIAGPLLKGNEGRRMTEVCLAAFKYWLAMAENSDANQNTSHPIGQTRWIQGRR